MITVFKSALEHAHAIHEVVIIDGSGLQEEAEEEEEEEVWRTTNISMLLVKTFAIFVRHPCILCTILSYN